MTYATIDPAWATFLAIIGPALVAVLVAIAAYIKALANKIDENTKLTKQAKEEATKAHKEANTAVESAKEAVKKTEEALTSVEVKIDDGTKLLTETKEATVGMKTHTEVCTAEIDSLRLLATDHGARIAALETQMNAFSIKLDGVTKDISSTRHEMRGHFGTIMNKLDILAISKPKDN